MFIFFYLDHDCVGGSPLTFCIVVDAAFRLKSVKATARLNLNLRVGLRWSFRPQRWQVINLMLRRLENESLTNGLFYVY